MDNHISLLNSIPRVTPDMLGRLKTYPISERIISYLWRRYFQNQVVPCIRKLPIKLKQSWFRVHDAINSYDYFAQNIYWRNYTLCVYPGDWDNYQLTLDRKKHIIMNYYTDGIREYPLINEMIQEEYYSLPPY